MIHVIDPVYETIAVTFDVVAFAGQDASAVMATCIANVTAYLQPAMFRLGALSPAIAGGEVIPPPNRRHHHAPAVCLRQRAGVAA